VTFIKTVWLLGIWGLNSPLFVLGSASYSFRKETAAQVLFIFSAECNVDWRTVMPLNTQLNCDFTSGMSLLDRKCYFWYIQPWCRM